MDEFTFAWEGADTSLGPWRHLRVVDFRGTEELSQLSRYEITLLARAPAPEVDPRDLVTRRATLRIATTSEPAFKVVHGVITEAEELFEHPSGMTYRVALMPPLVRAAHRRRCRIFLDKTLRQIITAALLEDPNLRLAPGAMASPDEGDDLHFKPAEELLTWRISDPSHASRLDQADVRPYCVQYNESDLDFVARLLEEEGISYHFEHGEERCVLVLSDTDVGRPQLAPALPLGEGIRGRSVSSMRLGARLRARKVTLAEYNWKNPALDMTAAAPGEGGEDLFTYEYPGRYPETPGQGAPLARAQLERLLTEAEGAVGAGTCRLLGAGSIFRLEAARHRHAGEYLVTRLEVRGEQAGVLPDDAATQTGVPFSASFECARRGREGQPAESRFRPARSTPRPRIQGSQTAFVTAAPGAEGDEIHIGGPSGAEIGCVRLRFHWDRDAARLAKEPSSCWVRVSQTFAGSGEGGVFHPRVGTECIVEFEDGDPDRPIVTGRVYNGKNRPPTTSPTTSTMKSATSPGGGSANELRFEDAAGKQQILLHTPRDWDSEVGRDRSETIGSNSASLVGANRVDKTGANRAATVGANDSQTIGMNASLSVGGDREVIVSGNQTRSTTGDEKLTIGGNHEVAVTGYESRNVTGFKLEQVTGFVNYVFNAERYTLVAALDSAKINGPQRSEVQGTQDQIVHGAQTTTLNAGQTVSVTGAQSVAVSDVYALAAGLVSVSSGGDATVTATGALGLEGATMSMYAHTGASLTAQQVQIEGMASCLVSSPSLTLVGTDSVQIGGGPAVLSCGGGVISMAGGIVKIN